VPSQNRALELKQKGGVSVCGVVCCCVLAGGGGGRGVMCNVVCRVSVLCAVAAP